MITPPKPGQALDITLDVSAVPWGTFSKPITLSLEETFPRYEPRLPPLHWPPAPPTARAPDTYEFRTISYLALRCTAPARIDLGAEWAALRRGLAHLESYADFGIGCEMPAWEDRANREDCYCDWWKADWVKAAWAAGLGPEEEEHCGGCECDPFGDSFACTSDCEGPL